MCARMTALLPEKINPTSPSEYKPVARLNTIYKVLTSVLASKIMEHS